MFEWLQESGYAADIPSLRKLYPPLKTFETWLRETTDTKRSQMGDSPVLRSRQSPESGDAASPVRWQS
jgi:hypothetical protein